VNFKVNIDTHCARDCQTVGLFQQQAPRLRHGSGDEPEKINTSSHRLTQIVTPVPKYRGPSPLHRGGEEGRIRLDTRYIKNLGYSSRANNKITLPMDLGPLTPSQPMGATPPSPTDRYRRYRRRGPDPGLPENEGSKVRDPAIAI